MTVEVYRTAAVAVFACLFATLVLGSVSADAKGRVVTGLTIPSKSLGRPIPYAAYLPVNNGSPLPVLYLLHSHGDSETAWLILGRLAETLDRIAGEGSMKPFIVIMPME